MADRTDYRRTSAVIAVLVLMFASALAFASADELDTFAVRGESVPEWLAFINSAKQQQPTGKSHDAIVAFTSAQQRAILDATNRILAARPGEPADRIANEEKLAALWTLVTLGDKQAASDLVSVAETLKNDSRAALAHSAAFVLTWHRLQGLKSIDDPAGREAEATDLVADVQRQLAAPEFDERLIVLAGKLPEDLERLYPRLALSAATGFATELARRDDGRSRRTADHLLGLARQWRLLGQRVEIEGPLIGGGRFDGNALRGHVVLVDFWATWCEPCVAELPALKALEARYRDRGLKLVGVSLDDDAERLARFLADRELPWPIICDPAGARDGRHALATKLGVDSVPTMILIDKQRRVTRIGTNLAALAQDIETLLTEPAAPAVPAPTIVEVGVANP